MKKIVPAPYIDQTERWVNGCESISSVMLLQAVGIDIDPKAEDIARENAAYNGFAAPAFTALTGNVTEDTALMDTLAANRYDLVLVNIVADSRGSVRARDYITRLINEAIGIKI